MDIYGLPRRPMLAAVRMVVDEATRSGNAQMEAIARDELAKALLAGDDWSGAYPEFDRAGELWLTLDQPANAAVAFFGAARSLFFLDRRADAAERLRRVARASLSANDLEQWQTAALGALDGLSRAERWSDLGEWAEEVAPIAARNQGPGFALLELHCRFHAAGMCVRHEDWSAALAHAERGIALGAHDPELAARLSASASLALWKLDRGEEALTTIDRAFEMANHLDIDDLRAPLITLLGMISEERPAIGARRFADLTAGYMLSGDRRLAALSRYHQGLCMELDRPVEVEAAAAVLAEAGHLLEDAGLRSDAADAYYRVCRLLSMTVFRSAERGERAYEAGCRASALAIGTGNWWLAGLSEGSVAFAIRPLGIGVQSERAARHYRRAARFYRRAGRCQEASGSWAAAMGQWSPESGALRALRMSRAFLRTFELGRREFVLPKVRRPQEHESSVGLLIAAGVAVKAARLAGITPPWTEVLWGFEEATKARVLQDELLSGGWDRAVAADPRLRDSALRSETLEAHLRRSEEGLRRLLLGRPRPDEVERLMAERDELKLAKAEADLELERLLRTQAPVSDNVILAPPLTPDVMARVLRPDEVYIGFLAPVIGSSVVRLTSLPGHSVTAAIIDPPDPEGMRAFARHLMTCDRLSDEHDQEEHETFSRFWVALVGDLPRFVTTALVSPHGELVAIPWMRAWAEYGPFQAHGRACALVPSAGVLRILRDRSNPQPDVAYIGVACNADGDLRGVEVEVANVHQRYFPRDRSVVLMTQESGRFLDLQQSSRVLHLACHADRNGLRLGPSRAAEWVAPVELAGSLVSADVLVLTGCRAGLFARDDTGEHLGVLRELLQATHARVVVASREAVPDEAGVLFADLLMTALTGHTPGQWEAPEAPLPVGAAVTWAVERLRTTSLQEARGLFPDTGWQINPSDATWWSPWLVVGDPAVGIVGEE